LELIPSLQRSFWQDALTGKNRAGHFAEEQFERQPRHRKDCGAVQAAANSLVNSSFVTGLGAVLLISPDSASFNKVWRKSPTMSLR
jgi:hypothetical protein